MEVVVVEVVVGAMEKAKTHHGIHEIMTACELVMEPTKVMLVVVMLVLLRVVVLAVLTSVLY